MIAGITVLPSRSTRVAPAGIATSPLRPIRVIVPRSTRMAAFSIAGLPSPKIPRAPSNSTLWALAGCGCMRNAAAARRHKSALRSMALLTLDVELADQAREQLGLALDMRREG